MDGDLILYDIRVEKPDIAEPNNSVKIITNAAKNYSAKAMKQIEVIEHQKAPFFSDDKGNKYDFGIKRISKEEILSNIAYVTEQLQGYEEKPPGICGGIKCRNGETPSLNIPGIYQNCKNCLADRIMHILNHGFYKVILCIGDVGPDTPICESNRLKLEFKENGKININGEPHSYRITKSNTHGYAFQIHVDKVIIKYNKGFKPLSGKHQANLLIWVCESIIEGSKCKGMNPDYTTKDYLELIMGQGRPHLEEKSNGSIHIYGKCRACRLPKNAYRPIHHPTETQKREVTFAFNSFGNSTETKFKEYTQLLESENSKLKSKLIKIQKEYDDKVAEVNSLKKTNERLINLNSHLETKNKELLEISKLSKISEQKNYISRIPSKDSDSLDDSLDEISEVK